MTIVPGRALPPGHMERIYYEHGVPSWSPAKGKSMDVSLPAYGYHAVLEQRVACLEGHPKVAEITFEQAAEVVDRMLSHHFQYAYNEFWRKTKMRSQILDGLGEWDETARFHVFNELMACLTKKERKNVFVVEPRDKRRKGRNDELL